MLVLQIISSWSCIPQSAVFSGISSVEEAMAILQQHGKKSKHKSKKDKKSKKEKKSKKAKKEKKKSRHDSPGTSSGSD